MAEKMIKADGTTYRFNPGPNGSLTDMRTYTMKPVDAQRPHVSRVVPILRARRKQSAQAVTASVRG